MPGQEDYAIAQVAIFAVLAQPITYITFKHGKSGLMGWLYLGLFCIIRVLGGALTIHADSTHVPSTAALVVSSVGTTPLLLGIMGVLHEARNARHPSVNKWLEWPFIINFHAFVSTGVIILIIGVIDSEGSNPTSTDKHLIDVGMAILVIAYVGLALFTAFSALSRQTEYNAPGFRDGTKLYTAVAWSLPFLGLRIAYGAAALIDTRSKLLSPTSGSVALKVCFGLIPEVIILTGFAVVGIMTRDTKLRKTAYVRPGIHAQSDEEAAALKRGQTTTYRHS